MKNTQATFTGPTNATIFYQLWEPEVERKAVVILAHGASEHSGRYQHLAGRFVEHGYVVAALDHLGQGRSEGEPGFIARFDDYIETLEKFRERIQAAYPGLPCILVGHSMGGLIAARHLLDAQSHYVACVLSGPAIKSDVEPPAWQLAILRFISKIAPRLGVIQLDAAGVSRDADVVKAYLDDPLVYTGKLSARKVVEMFKTMQRVQAEAAQIKLPILLLHGGDDKLTAPAGSQYLYDTVSSSDKKLVIYPGLYHEIFNEPEREQVCSDVLAWCDSRLSG